MSNIPTKIETYRGLKEAKNQVKDFVTVLTKKLEDGYISAMYSPVVLGLEFLSEVAPNWCYPLAISVICENRSKYILNEYEQIEFSSVISVPERNEFLKLKEVSIEQNIDFSLLIKKSETLTLRLIKDLERYQTANKKVSWAYYNLVREVISHLLNNTSLIKYDMFDDYTKYEMVFICQKSNKEVTMEFDLGVAIKDFKRAVALFTDSKY